MSSNQPTELLIALLKPTFGSFYHQLQKQNVDITAISSDDFWDMFMSSISSKSFNSSASSSSNTNNAGKKVKVVKKTAASTPTADQATNQAQAADEVEKKAPTKKKVNKVNKLVVATSEVSVETKEVVAPVITGETCQYANCPSKIRKGDVVGGKVYCASHAKKMLSKSGSFSTSSSNAAKVVTIVNKRPASLISSDNNPDDDFEPEPERVAQVAKKTKVIFGQTFEIPEAPQAVVTTPKSFDFTNEAPVDIDDQKYWVLSSYELDGYQDVQLHSQTQLLLIKQADKYVCIGYLDKTQPQQSQFVSIDKLKTSFKHIVSWIRMSNIGLYSSFVAPVNPFISFSQQIQKEQEEKQQHSQQESQQEFDSDTESLENKNVQTQSASNAFKPSISWDDLMDDEEEEEIEDDDM